MGWGGVIGCSPLYSICIKAFQIVYFAAYFIGRFIADLPNGIWLNVVCTAGEPTSRQNALSQMRFKHFVSFILPRREVPVWTYRTWTSRLRCTWPWSDSTRRSSGWVTGGLPFALYSSFLFSFTHTQSSHVLISIEHSSSPCPAPPPHSELVHFKDANCKNGSAWLYHARPPAAELASVIELIQPQGLQSATRRETSVWSEWRIQRLYERHLVDV